MKLQAGTAEWLALGGRIANQRSIVSGAFYFFYSLTNFIKQPSIPSTISNAEQQRQNKKNA